MIYRPTWYLQKMWIGHLLVTLHLCLKASLCKTFHVKTSLTFFTYCIYMYNKILDCDWFSACQFVTYLARNHVGVQLQVPSLNFLYLDTHSIYTSLTCALMAFFAMFCTVFNLYEKRYRCFHWKELPKRHSIPKFVIDRIN